MHRTSTAQAHRLSQHRSSSDYYQTRLQMRSIPATETTYVVVCRGPNCREQGGLGLRKRLLQLLGRDDASVRLLGYSCFGQCDHGPNVVIFPSNEWRGKLRLDDAAALVEYARGNGLAPGRLLEPTAEERAQHLANIGELVATVERDRAARSRARRWWWPF